MGALHEFYDRYSDRVDFFVVYIREAHPEDGWVLASNRAERIALADPATSDERADVAQSCVVKTAIRMPTLVDGTDDEVARQYGAWPDRLYLVARDGTIAYQGAEGPFGFKPEELEAALAREVG